MAIIGQPRTKSTTHEKKSDLEVPRFIGGLPERPAQSQEREDVTFLKRNDENAILPCGAGSGLPSLAAPLPPGAAPGAEHSL